MLSRLLRDRTFGLLILFEQLISLMWGYNWHIFKPKDVEPNDVNYGVRVLTEQVRRFGPVPLGYEEIANDDRLGILTFVINYIKDNQLQRPFSMLVNEELSQRDKDFILRIMKLDPRDRLTAKELLQDKRFA
jgi:casein kinase II subunit alpha